MPFSNIIAHDSVIHLLKSAFVQDRIPSAYLFTGLKGVGKSLTAYTFAKMLNCDSHINCDICDNCRLMKHKAHHDFIRIVPDGLFIKIDQIHRLQEQLALKPFKAKKRVVLIKNAHQFNQESGNAFLKTLEEPALNTLLILTSTNENQVLETIASRCQKVSFPPLKREHLKTVIADKYQTDEKYWTFIINYSDGGIRKDLINEPETYLNLREKTLQILEKLSLSSMPYHGKTLEEIVTQKKTSFFLECCKKWFRDQVLLKEGQKTNLHNADLLPRLQKNIEEYTLEQLHWSFDLTLETEKAIQLNAGKNLALEALLVQLKQIKEGKLLI